MSGKGSGSAGVVAGNEGVGWLRAELPPRMMGNGSAVSVGIDGRSGMVRRFSTARPLVLEGTAGLVSAENGRGSVGRGTSAGRSADRVEFGRTGGSSRSGNAGSADSVGLVAGLASKGFAAGVEVIGGVTRGLPASLGNRFGFDGAGVTAGAAKGAGVGTGAGDRVGVEAGVGVGAGVGVVVGVG